MCACVRACVLCVVQRAASPRVIVAFGVQGNLDRRREHHGRRRKGTENSRETHCQVSGDSLRVSFVCGLAGWLCFCVGFCPTFSCSVVFCEAVAVYGIIMAILMRQKWVDMAGMNPVRCICIYICRVYVFCARV